MIGAWVGELSRTEKGVIRKDDYANALMIFQNDELLKGLLALNEFTQELDVTRDVELNDIAIKQGTIDAVFDTAVFGYIANKYHVTLPTSFISKAIINEANQHKYNPLRDRLNSFVWDGVERIPQFFQAYLGAEDTEETKLIARLFFTGAVAKVYNPRVKVDYVLDLVGAQGVGKTTLLSKLGGSYYTDNITDFYNRDNYQKMIGKWIVNDDELVATKKSSPEDFKKFVSQLELEFRQPYAPRSQKYLKNFVITRTTNQTHYLKDYTGERRILPIMCDKERQQRHPVTDLHSAELVQLWAEAVSLYANDPSLSTTSEEEWLLNCYRKSFMVIDEIHDMVQDYLELPIPVDFYTSNLGDPKYRRKEYYRCYFETGKPPKGLFSPNTERRDFVTVKDLAWEVFGIEITGNNMRNDTLEKIKEALKTNNDWKYNTKGRRGFKKRN